MSQSASPQNATGADRHREANRLYAALFGITAPEIVCERFEAASPIVERKYTADDISQYRTTLKYDVEAIEIAGRYTRRLPLLSEKFRLVVYLAETMPDNQKRFVNNHDNFPGAVWAIFTGALRSAYKLFKGLIIIGRATRG